MAIIPNLFDEQTSGNIVPNLFDEEPKKKTNKLQDFVQGVYREQYAPVMHGLSALGFGIPKMLAGKAGVKEQIFPEQTSLSGKILRGVSEIGGNLLGAGKFFKGAQAVSKIIPILGRNTLTRGAISGALTGGAYAGDKENIPTAISIGGALGGLGGLGEGIRMEGKLGGHFINSLIKPTHKDKMFGKNPGQAIAKEGLVATTLDGLGKQVQSKLTVLNELKDKVIKNPINLPKIIKGTGLLEPLNIIKKEFGKSPLTHKDVLKRVNNIISDLSANKGNIDKLSLESAYNLKYQIRDMQKWESLTNADNKVDVALKKIYHLIDSAIDEQIPELQQLNSRISNLISADKAIQNRVSTLANLSPIESTIRATSPFATGGGAGLMIGGAMGNPFLGGLIGSGIGKVAQSPLAKTGLARMFTKTYPALKK